MVWLQFGNTSELLQGDELVAILVPLHELLETLRPGYRKYLRADTGDIPAPPPSPPSPEPVHQAISPSTITMSASTSATAT